MVVFWALLSSVMWGTSDFLGGTMTKRLPAIAVVGVGQVFGLALTVVAATLAGVWSTPLGYLPWSLLCAVTGIGGLVTFYTALARGKMSIVAPIAAAGVIVPVVFGLLAGDVPTGLQALGVVVGIVGLVLATGPELSGGNRQSVGLAAVAGVLFGICVTGIQRGSTYDPIMLVLGIRVIAVAFFVVLALSLRSVGGVRRGDLLPLAIIGCFDVSANIFLGIAASGGHHTIVAVLGSLYPVVTVLLAWQFRHERIARIQYVGIATALLGIVLISA